MKTDGKIKVSILTVVLNGEKTISRTIESVLNQTYVNIEYIILDGCSTDKTLEIAQTYQSAFDNCSGKTLQIISQPDNGMFEALNKGAALASGELVGQINADDWYEQDAVETMVSLYEREHYDVAWGSSLIHKDSGDMIKHARLGRLMTTTGWCHPSVFSRREILLSFPYDENCVYGDLDYMISIRQSGIKVIVTDEIITNFSFGGMSTKKESFGKVIERANAAYITYKKHGLSRFYWLHRFMMESCKYILG